MQYFFPLREIIRNKFIEFCDTSSIIELKYLVRDTSELSQYFDCRSRNIHQWGYI